MRGREAEGRKGVCGVRGFVLSRTNKLWVVYKREEAEEQAQEGAKEEERERDKHTFTLAEWFLRLQGPLCACVWIAQLFLCV